MVPLTILLQTLLLFSCNVFTTSQATATSSETSQQRHRWSRQAPNQCIYQDRTLSCSPDTTPCRVLSKITNSNDFIILNSISGLQLSSSMRVYDVVAYRLCGGKKGSDITLEEAASNGQLCLAPKSLSAISIRFQGCNEFFVGGNADLEIHVFSNPPSGCKVAYKLLFINTTSKKTS